MVCGVKAKSEVKALIEVQAFVSPSQKLFLSQKTVRKPSQLPVRKPLYSKPLGMSKPFQDRQQTVRLANRPKTVRKPSVRPMIVGRVLK